jgi:hypothetical protein
MPTRWTLPTEESRRLFQQQKDYLLDLCRRLDAENDFTFDDWTILFHLLENYRPDYIFEVGRGAGNTTCVFLDYCTRHEVTGLCSVDLYDHWHQYSENLLPRALIEKACDHQLVRQDFLDFDCQTIVENAWRKLVLFWDLSDVQATRRLVAELLPMLERRNVLLVVHDVGFVTGRPRRFRWRNFESLYPDLEIIGPYLDKTGWRAEVIAVEQIFGHYRNSGHWLLCCPF